MTTHEDLKQMFQLQELRIDNLEQGIDRVRGCERPCDDLVQLKKDLAQCSKAKDEKIGELSKEVHGMKSILTKLDADMQANTEAIQGVRASLDTIATNTTQFIEVLNAYNNIKGTFWVLSNMKGFLVAAAAMIAAWVFLSGTSIVIPK